MAITAPRTPWPRSVLLGVVFSLVVGVIVLAFSWPSVTLDPKHVPVAITGPTAAVDQVTAALTADGNAAFALHPVTDRDAAVQAIQRRDDYGAIVLGSAPEVLTASAAGTTTNQLMLQVQATLQAQLQKAATAQATAAGAPAPTIHVALTDVVPLSGNDPRGAGLSAAAFPLVFGGMIGGIGITFAISGVWRRLLALVIYVVAAGFVIAGIMQGWFGVLEGSYVANAAGFSLTLLAMSATIVGFASLVGNGGIAIGPVLFLLIGNPISGATFPKEFLPAPWGDVGQAFPPGAGATLVRDLSYFPDAELTGPILALSIWAAAGLLFAVLGHFRGRGIALETVETGSVPTTA